MSNSFRKTPIIGNHRASEKDDKKAWHRRLRVKQKVELKKGEDARIIDHREVSDTWLMAKDGKQPLFKKWGNNKEYLRK